MAPTTLISAKGCTLSWRYNNGNFHGSYIKAYSSSQIAYLIRISYLGDSSHGALRWGGVGWGWLTTFVGSHTGV